MTDLLSRRDALSRVRKPAAAVVLVLAAACTPAADPAKPTAGPAEGPAAVPAAAVAAADVASPAAAAAARRLGALPGRARADVLVVVDRGLSATQVSALRALSQGGFTTLRVGDLRIAGQKQRAIGVNANSFRAFAPKGTAEATPVWQAVARGDVVVAHAEAKSLRLPLGQRIDVSGAKSSAKLRLGALATTGLPGVVAVVSDGVAAKLGLSASSGAVLGAGAGDPVLLAGAVRKVVGASARVDLLTQPAPPTAFLTGSRAAREFGAFSYRFYPDGTIEPDARWVAENIRYARLPIIGFVQCHRLTIPQLRRALQEVEAAGLASKITSYAGCYVPRFIERNPTRAVSLHTWGIAFDFNAATNQMGTRGDMDPRLVEIFERWGFRWGGRWSVPDPMHFELGALLNT